MEFENFKTNRIGGLFNSERLLKIRIKNKVKDGFLFEILPSSTSRSKEDSDYSAARDVTYHFLDKTDNSGLFFIETDSLKQNGTTGFLKPRVLSVSGIILPMKFRFGNDQPGSEFSIDQSISVGPVINVSLNKWGSLSPFQKSIVIGFNVSTIGVDEKTVPGIFTSKTTSVGLTPLLGFNVSYHDIGFGVVTGLDILTGKAGKEWAYRKSPWLGISIGTSLIPLSSKERKTPGQ